MTATVETVAEQLDLAPVVAQEKILPAVARQVTISDCDVGMFSGTKDLDMCYLLGCSHGESAHCSSYACW